MSINIDKIIRSKRKTLAIEVNDDAQVIVKAPKYICDNDIGNFVLQHTDWIIKRKKHSFNKIQKLLKFEYNYHESANYKKNSRKVLKEKCEFWSQKIGVKYTKLNFSKAQKKWGSCTHKSVISLNWRLIFMPDNIIDYVVIHELCHIKHLNHSKKFWNEVLQYSPDFKKCKKYLNENDYLMMIE